MVDFKKLMEERKLAGQKLKEETLKKAGPTLITKKAPEPIDNLRHLMNHHQDDMTEWEWNFCQNNFNYLKLNPGAGLSVKAKDKLGEILAEVCGSMCHALDKAEIPHG